MITESSYSLGSVKNHKARLLCLLWANRPSPVFGHHLGRNSFPFRTTCQNNGLGPLGVKGGAILSERAYPRSSGWGSAPVVMKDFFGDEFAITLRVRDRFKMVTLGIALKSTRVDVIATSNN
jgi:hypothetical protein